MLMKPISILSGLNYRSHPHAFLATLAAFSQFIDTFAAGILRLE